MRQIAHGRVVDRRDSVWSPGLVVVAAAVVAFVVCVANFALGAAGPGVAAAIVGLLAFGGGLAWLAMDRRRVRDAERARNIGR
ncbi:hypothetical protein BST11_16575 [Mycobacterium alsense]|uniref:LapA family protein n=1 Tax=Mycobacterium alsense TaxID=324058 RepID=A0AA42BXD0_9MYCO|nr:hypothetical protein [Mycobacterium alsense]MCV7377367.1 LapA family protein [Mycobacterium alsense]OQZ89686.1 hypothetical protein BST11_16575 [Mycobacterium alsense]